MILGDRNSPAVLFMGTPDFAVPTLQALIDHRVNLVAVYTKPDKRSGRGRTVHISPIKRLAFLNRIPIEQPKSLKDDSDGARKLIKQYDPTLIVVCAYGLFLGSSILNHRCLNLHPSLLPKHRGATPIQGAILAGEQTTGVTLMRMDQKMDHGPIVSQSKTQIVYNETAGQLHDRLAKLAAEHLIEQMPTILSSRVLRVTSQDHSQATFTKSIKSADAWIDWQGMSAVEISQRVRAFNPWPGARTHLGKKMLKIHTALPLSMHFDLRPGTVVQLLEDAIGVVTEEATLELVTVQLEGKKAMSAKDFARGRPDFIGSVLT